MASPEGGDDDRPPSKPPSHAGDHHTHRPLLDLSSLPPYIHSTARPCSSTVLPENAIVLALPGHTSKLPTSSLPPHGTNRPLKTKKNQSKTKTSSRVPPHPTVDAEPPTLPSSVDPKQLLTISTNQPCHELTMPTFAASGSGNISPRQSQLHPASAQVPVATQDHSSIQKPPHDDLKQPPYAQNNALAEPPFAAPGSGNNNSRPPQLHCTSELAPVASNDHSRSREPAIDDLKQSTHSPSSELTEPQLAAHGAGHSPPRTAHLRSAAEQISAAITDQHGFREPTQDDLNQPPPLQLPENMLAAASETSSRVDLISTLTATITAAVEAILRPNLALPTSTSPVQPIPPLITHSTAAAKEQQQPALDIPKTQNPNANRVIFTQTHDPRNLTHTRAHLTTHTQTQTQTQTLEATQTRNHQTHPKAPIQQPLNQISAHTPKPNYNQTQHFTKTPFNPSKNSYASIINPASILNPDAPPHPQKSFSDVVSGPKDSTISFKPASLMRGEPAVIFTTEEIAVMAEPFKLALVGKFSFGRPSMDIIRKFFISLGLKGNSQISLLDNRHILIKLSLEEDYSRIWVRQTWYVNGRGMRIFKWSKDFRCATESPIVPVWVSLPHLPVHFIHCKAALHSIAAAIGTPLRVDHATATVNRPSVARILIEYDISQPLLPRIWIGEGDSGFWQDVVFEKVPAYCSSCRHLGHSFDSCFIANPGLRKAPQSTAPSQRPAPDKGKQAEAPPEEHQRPVLSDPSQSGDKGKMKQSDIVIQPQQPSSTRFVAISDRRTQGLSTQPPVDLPQAPPIDESRLVDTSPPGGPLDHRASHPGDVTTSPGDIPVHTVDHTQVGFNSHSTDIPDFDDDDGHRRLGSSRSTEEVLSDSDRELGDEGRFLTDSEEIHLAPAPDAVIESFDSERVPFISVDRLEAIRVQLGMEHGLSSQSGKIWIFWSAPFSVELLHDMGQVIHCRVSHSILPDPVLVSYVYASCFMDVREDLWAALESFADSHDLPWIVGGDFNVVQAVSEISGGHPQPQGAIDAFNLALLDCGLEDAGFVGSPFTWTNGHTWRRLDRVVCNARWSAFFSVSRVSHLNRTASDHSPLLLSWDRDTIRGPSRFKFLHVWLKHPGLIDIVRSSWNAPVVGAGMRAFQQKLVRLKLCLKAWNKDVFGNVFSQVQQAEEEVAQKERLYDISGSADDRASFSEARARLQQALLREEIFMRQQSSVRWVREGDSNTRFFHAMFRKKRQIFHVHRIRDDSSSEWITDPSAVATSAVGFYRGLLSGDAGQFQQADFDTIPTLVTAEDDVVLCREPDIDDVRRAVFSIDPESAPGPDGFCSRFYQVCWDIVGRDLLDAVLDYFRGSAMPRGFQSTLLVLLPKKESPSSWADFRPISLCNVSNKVITKLLVQRLSTILPRIISPTQSGFVPGRVIHDNVLLVQELTHDLNRRTRGNNVVLKLDMEKAYDRMSWPFILQMLRCFGFSERWISLIRRAVYGPWFSVLVNGAIHGYFPSERGLRQGDPISPCLFIIAAEFLSRGLVHLYSRYPSVRYRSAASTDISHLSFADDIVIFANGSRCSLQRVMDFLHRYQVVSGQLISRTKSSFYIGKPASASCRSIVHSVTGFQWRQLPFIYLGCPIFTGCLKISYFDGMVRKVRERISGWANRLLSFGGKLILIRHVLSALPLHLFHVLRPPSTVIQSLERLFTRFLWGDSDGRRRIHWCRWPAVCFPVDEGGLGIRSFDDMAEAFEIKLWWRFRQQSSLWASFMKSKYCRSVHPGVIQFRYPASPLWRRLCMIRDTVGPHERWLVGQGECSFWYDCWLGSCPLYFFNPAAASSRPVSFYWQGTVWDRGPTGPGVRGHRDGGVAARRFERRKTGMIGAVLPVSPVSARRGAVHAPGGTAGRDREAADAFGGVRAGPTGPGVRGHRDGGVAARRFERRKTGMIGAVLPVWPVSARRGAVHAPGGTAGRDREAADAFGGVRAGPTGPGVRGHRDGGVAARRFERRKTGMIGAVLPVWPVSARRGAVHAPGGTAGRDREAADAFGGVRAGPTGPGVRGHRDGGVAARRFERRKTGMIGAVWPVSARRGAVHAPGGTAGRDREAADAFGGVRAGAAGWGVARGAIAHVLGGRKEGAVTHDPGLRFRFRRVPRDQGSGGIGMGG
ncbi:reverse transcriptase domain-containing protein [Citrus sinensis]|nr:reverse transcriptase domain-containing protein [Citrus sinensis]